MLHHLRPGFLSDQKIPTARAVFRYFRDTQDDAAGILLASLADARATRGPFKTKHDLAHHEKIIFKLIDEYFNEKSKVRPKKIVDGHALMKALGIKPGPLVGDLLLKIQEAQAEGKVKTKDQAISLGKKLADKAGENINQKVKTKN
jgi:tRNA nucleotidyltransferase/poly(A) polymerase